MTQQLEDIFEELGIAQYLDVFVDQGFDTWETILDITESDLDALGVKLGHRRKLQRRIANSRGPAQQISLVPASQAGDNKVGRVDGVRRDATKGNLPVVAKRKYRRHPKPDENAPERPPSAYVLFSNKMRDDLKGRNLSFTEIAKLVGENWQSLSPLEKEPFESQAVAAKETYNQDLANYKKTPEYRRYIAYLAEFKAKYAHQAQEKDASKRVRLLERTGSNTSPSSSMSTPGRTSRSGSNSEDSSLNEQSTLTRHKRVNSSVSADSPYPLGLNAPSRQSLTEERALSPEAGTDRLPERSPTFGDTSPRDISSRRVRQALGWDDKQRSLPPLSDVLDQRSLLNSGSASHDNIGYILPRNHITESPGSIPGLVGGNNKPPTLQTEQSSSTSTSSGSSYGFPRTPVEPSLPIHALLDNSTSGKPYETIQPVSGYYGNSSGAEQYKSGLSMHSQSNGATPLPLSNGSHTQRPPFHRGSPTIPVHPSHQLPPPPALKSSDSSLDGMTALLKAGEIVDRRLG